MTSKLDWAELTDTWKVSEPVESSAPDFAIALRRRVRSTLLVVAVEVALTGGLLWVTWLQLGRDLTGSGAATLFVLWGSWVAATGFAWWNRRGQWARTAASTLEFVRLSRERAERKVRIAWFTAGMLVVQIGFVSVLAALAPPPGLLTAGGWITVGIVAAVYAGWAVRYHRVAITERDHYAELERSLGEGIVE